MGLSRGGSSDEEEGGDKKPAAGLPGQARVKPVARETSRSHQAGKCGWKPSSAGSEWTISVSSRRNREDWGHENGHPSMAQFPQSLDLDPGLPLARSLASGPSVAQLVIVRSLSI